MAQTPIKDQEQIQKHMAGEDMPDGMRRRRVFATVLSILAALLIITSITLSSLSSETSPATASHPSSNPSFLPAPHLPSGPGVPTTVNMGMPGAPTSITTLQAPLTAPHMDRFTLTAENAIITLTPGVKIAAWTFNGASPASLRVHQGDLVVVNVVNHLSFGITLHWHGIDSFNSADGVAGVTQDAIKAGQTYTYRFIPPDAGN
jgi:FtsP/CotA-like multicopper oxidase with cupredoxin domain